MLRGIYEENLRLKEPGHRSPQRTQPQKLAMWSAIGAIALLIGTAGPLDRVIGWVAPGQSTLGRSAPPPPAHAANDTNLAAPTNGDASPSAAEPATPRLPPKAVPPAASEAVEAARAATTDASGAASPSVAQPFDVPRTIVIDAGHGGHDFGSIGKAGTREKDITLDIARRLKEKLAYRPEYRIFLVRGSDAFMPSNERVRYVNSLKTDLFISIHINDLPDTSVDTVEIYHFGPSQDTRTRKLAQLENQYWSYTISEYEEHIRTDMKLDASKALAESIQASVLGDRQHETQIVLKPVVGAAALVVLLG